MEEYVFQETEPGKYKSITEFTAQPNVDYSLSITTQDGRSYTSAAMQLTQNTRIDNLYLERGFNENNDEGVSIFVDTFDPTGNSQYYRFTYEETYKIKAPLYDHREIVFHEGSFFDHDILLRPEQEQICYATDKSNTTIIKSTTGLTEDRLDQFRVRFINRNNYIMSHRYSILVKQYVQTREALTFYETLKDFSESESLFSQVQPGFLEGNVISVNNNQEKVLGFFEVSSVDTGRIYFNYADLFPGEDLPYFPCQIVAPDLASIGNPPGHPLWNHINIFGYQYLDENTPDSGYYLPLAGPYILVDRPCGDCTALGKTETPEFWEE